MARDPGGKVVLGAISGAVVGLGIALLLQQGGIWPLDRLSLFAFPLALAVVGAMWSVWSPLRRS